MRRGSRRTRGHTWTEKAYCSDSTANGYQNRKFLLESSRISSIFSTPNWHRGGFLLVLSKPQIEFGPQCKNQKPFKSSTSSRKLSIDRLGVLTQLQHAMQIQYLNQRIQYGHTSHHWLKGWFLNLSGHRNALGNGTCQLWHPTEHTQWKNNRGSTMTISSPMIGLK
jgi:hypothetical protein